MNALRTVLIVLVLLAALQSTWFFLGMARVGVISWLTFNACAVANITLIIGYVLFLVLKTRLVMYMAVLPLFFFGTGGLFVFPWGGWNIIPQISHIIMTLNLIVLVYDMFRTGDFKTGALGLLLSIVLFGWFLGFQQSYVYSHRSEFQKIMKF
ncbi:MAG: hypothetical protein PHF84_01265 [bacterium]|nr:hypothetical protein [bacterium]